MKYTGKDLIEWGYKPGRWFSYALRHINNNRMTKARLMTYLDSIQPVHIEPHDKPIPYQVNIEAEHDSDAENIEIVHATMQEVMKTPTVVSGAVMPDACPTGSIGRIPVGGIVITKNAIHPSMHSADICCSVMMTSLGVIDPKNILDTAQETTHFGGGGRQDPFPLHPNIELQIRNNRWLNTEKGRHLAHTHLGTQGDGNHFLFVGISENTGETVMVTHHGSRGLGAYLYKKGMHVAENHRKLYSPNTTAGNGWIPYETEEGRSYWEALQIVRSWTKENHEVLHRTVCEKKSISPTTRFWNEHNFVFKKGGLFYHAKGATPLSNEFVPDSQNGLRLIPLNMSEPILVVKGDTTESNLGFAPHGAGRNISRSAHKRSKSSRTIESIFEEETKGLDVRFYSGHIDISELPSAYKKAEQVQRQMEKFGLGNIVDRIMPYGCVMAGDWKKGMPWRKKEKRIKEKRRE